MQRGARVRLGKNLSDWLIGKVWVAGLKMVIGSQQSRVKLDSKADKRRRRFISAFSQGADSC